jgi:hypothetical protein
MSNGALKPTQKLRRLERCTLISLIVLVLAIAGTVHAFRSLASPQGGPEAMFDGWLLGPLAVGAGIIIIAAVAPLSCLVDLLRYRRIFRSRSPELPFASPPTQRLL